MAYRLFVLLPLLLASVSADSMHATNDVASVAEPMAPVPAPTVDADPTDAIESTKNAAPDAEPVVPISAPEAQQQQQAPAAAAASTDDMKPKNNVASVAEPAAPIPAPEAQQQQPAPVAAAAPTVISHEQAGAVIKSAVAKAQEIKSPSNIAVSDPAGHLISFLRMDGALLVSIEVAQKKAKTVSMFGGKYRTGDLYNATSPGGPLYGIQTTNNGLLFFGGGVPLKSGGNFIGAIGVSGGTVDQDQTIANAAAQSVNLSIPAAASKALVDPIAAPQAPISNAPVLTQDED
ncbi:hypothetical protein E2P81_ATG01196 [Venturia nashicola]|uniref:DUF336-domain-containing protein n=1 Tax=Venturia nashicola TaxID=86259 RepID=A0A4Z1PD60_9PEZI|nr:hypothetical protein E6O75_ATG01223 [Venturia nashicola]TLD38653.1 hypothetical protein E2P81_ATG01196 [Venturia nashicola]